MIEKRRDFAELIELLAKQREAYRLLLALSCAQPRVLEEAGARGILKIVARKEDVLAELETIRRSLEPYTDEWEEMLKALPEPARGQIEAVVGETAEILAALKESEKAAYMLVESQRNSLASKTSSIKGGLTAVKAYAAHGTSVNGRYLDGES